MKTVSVIKGDGIGPEIIESAIKIINHFNLNIEFEEITVGKSAFDKYGELIPKNAIESIEKNKIVLKGPTTTPIGNGHRSVNVSLRKMFDLYSNIRPTNNSLNISGRYQPFSITVFRENTEGLYAGIEKYIDEDTAVSEKKITRKASERIIKEAFDYAVKKNINKVTLAHKANILKYTDGMFLDIGRKISKEYPEIIFEEYIIDNMCAKLVDKPENFQIIVTMNLYGDIISDLLGGMAGSIGILPSINIGDKYAFFEPVHGSAPDIAGKNIANPSGAILSASYLLEHMGYQNEALLIMNSVYEILKNKETRTMDLGGPLNTKEFTNIIIDKISKKQVG